MIYLLNDSLKEPTTSRAYMNNFPDAASVGGAAVLSLPAIAFYFKKIFTKFALEDTHTAMANAQIALFDQLRAEVVRLSESNEKLSQLNTSLDNSLAELREENSALRAEIVQLKQTCVQMAERIAELSRAKVGKPGKRVSAGPALDATVHYNLSKEDSNE
jgi:septal ring factor EnvC (AmiA/AmiB activator)